MDSRENVPQTASYVKSTPKRCRQDEMFPSHANVGLIETRHVKVPLPSQISKVGAPFVLPVDQARLRNAEGLTVDLHKTQGLHVRPKAPLWWDGE